MNRASKGKRNGLVMAVVALLSCAAPALAADEISPARMAAAKELIAVSGTGDTLGGTRMPDLITRQVKRTVPNIDDAAIAELQRICQEEFATGGPVLLDEMTKMYASRFSESELKTMVAFYKTDTGKHLAAETPALADGSAKLAAAITSRIGERFRNYLQGRAAANKDKPAK